MFQDCCKKCGSTDLYTETKGNNTGLYCSDCGAWQRWLGKDERRAFEHAKKIENIWNLKSIKSVGENKTFYEDDDLLFLGVNLEKATKKLINDNIKKMNIDSMNEDERRGFDYALKFVYDLINAVTMLTDGEDFVVLTDDEVGTEYTIGELVDMAETRRRENGKAIQ